MQEDGLGDRGLTVIAYKGGVMAADTQLTDGNSACRVRKIVRLPDGGVAGGCGVWASAYAALRYLERGGVVAPSLTPDSYNRPCKIPVWL